VGTPLFMGGWDLSQFPFFMRGTFSGTHFKIIPQYVL